MSSPDKHISSWSMTDVHKYGRGELSAREMHALEKAALDDPFLADALEGLTASEDLDQDLSELRGRLEKKVTEKRSRIFLLPRLGIAAAVILLVGLGFIALYTSTGGKSKANTARATHSQPSAADVAAAPSAKPAAGSAPAPATAASEPAAEPATQSSATQAARDGEVAKLSDAQKAAAHLRRQEPAAASRAGQAGFRSVADSIAAPVSPEAIAPVAEDLAKKMPGVQTQKDSFYYNPDLAANSNSGLQTKPLLFSGQVLDTRNRPLAGVSLFLDGKRSGTVTDEEGYFKLYVPPQDTVRKLRVDYVGYDQTSVVLNSENRFGNVITLKEHEGSLNEVVVTGLGRQRKATMAEAPSDDQVKPDSLWIRAIPAIGRTAYLNYLAVGKKGLGADTSIHGTVSISFNVDQKGQLSEFKIEQSLSPAQDAGTIQLISEGPSWKLLRGKKARLLVSLAFP